MNLLASNYKFFVDWFWNPTFWLPYPIKWSDLQNKPSQLNYYPQFSDLWTPLIFAQIILIIRYFYEKTIAIYLAKIFGLDKSIHKYKRIDFISNKNTLRNGYIKPINGTCVLRNGYSNSTTLIHELKQNVSYDEIQSKAYNAKLAKFSESCWRFAYYLTAFTYGISILWKKPWFLDTKFCWLNFPYQHVSKDLYYYYMIQMGFYWSLTISQFFDTKRKDFWQMFAHHICTLLLMTFSWVTNMVRIGSLVLVIHDAVDYWLELTKMANYCKKKEYCNILFCIFASIWFITRLIIFPYRVIYPALFEAHKILETFFAAYYVFNGLLLLLLGLNAFWFYIICKMAYKSIKYGEIKKDERSDSDDCGSSNEPEVGDCVECHQEEFFDKID